MPSNPTFPQNKSSLGRERIVSMLLELVAGPDAFEVDGLYHFTFVIQAFEVAAAVTTRRRR